MSATSTAGGGAGSALDLGQVLLYYVLAPLTLLLVIGAVAWYTSAARRPDQYPVLRGAAEEPRDAGPDS